MTKISPESHRDFFLSVNEYEMLDGQKCTHMQPVKGYRSDFMVYCIFYKKDTDICSIENKGHTRNLLLPLYIVF